MTERTMKKLSTYLSLTKPRISVLFAFTGIVGLEVQGSLSAVTFQYWAIVLGIFFVGGAANALNQYFERDLDAKMTRTAQKRALPLKKITESAALTFSLIMALSGILLLIIFGNFLAGFIGLGLILFYSFFYTLYLKPRTPKSIVIGGVAGALAPVIAWVAVTGRVDWVPALMFAIIFFWSPPHFWALALYYKDDYAKVGLPMLPVVAGETVTRRHIFIYSLTLLPLSLSLYFLEALGLLYAFSALVLSVLFVVGAFLIYRKASLRFCRQFFAYSIFYIALLFVMMLLDATV